MFGKILIANRGEIAVRIIRACREMGIRAVAVYSEADREALHVRCADEAYNIGPAPAKESYLNIWNILAAAHRAKADAIHPGYGFLSENPSFAEACEKEGFVFIGPSAQVLSVVGNKLRARSVAEACGVPIVPGSQASVEGGEEALRIAESIGYPVLLKAAAGGGGKGMRVASNREELERAVALASKEAAAAFGDSTLFIEKRIEPARHVEVQILADNKGKVIHLGERDCSIQRRFQKVIEESPSPAVNDKLRKLLTESAIELTKAVGYRNAGTVEFLLDGCNFYFLEVNARLQVEHPVTEMVTGVDIVREQISIAAGLPLRLSQRKVALRGAAIQCRIYAENPRHDFMPSPGTIKAMNIPSGPWVRVDSGIEEGGEITLAYDGLIAKLIVWGASRHEAIERMKRALDEFEIEGVSTTIPFKRYIMNSALFKSGRFDTNFMSLLLCEWKESMKSPVSA